MIHSSFLPEVFDMFTFVFIPHRNGSPQPLRQPARPLIWLSLWLGIAPVAGLGNKPSNAITDCAMRII